MSPCLLAATLFAATAVPEIPFEKYELPNGLTVILSEDHRIPQVAVDLWYHVGAANQQPGKSGFAHLFEHLMLFAGAKHIGKKPFASIETQGGWANGQTSHDKTEYIDVLPSEYLPTALWIESDRMGWLLDSLDEKGIQVQRDVVSNERRENYENKAWGPTQVRTCDLLFPKPHPYYDCVIGTIADVQAASADDIKAFFRRYYVPNNASLTIVGDFDPVRTRELVERYFGPLARGAEVPVPTAEQPAIGKVIRETVPEPRVQVPGLSIVWKGVKRFSADEASGDVLESVLSGGKASRLYRELIERRDIATSVWANNPSERLGGEFSIGAVVKPGHATAELEAAIDSVVEEVRLHGVTADEVARAQRKIEAGMLRGLENVGWEGGKASHLNAYQMYFGDPGRLQWDLARYRAVTPDAVQRFAQTYLLPGERVILDVQPVVEPPSKPAGKPISTAEAR